MEKTRTVRVTGRAVLRVTPDQICIYLTLEGQDQNYELAVEKSAEKTRAVKESLATVGFDSEDIRTTRFSIDPEYEGYDENGVWKQRFTGYRFNHGLKVLFDADKEKLGQVFSALAHCSAKPEFRVSYRVKDQEKAKSELIAKAVEDAKEKAKVLADASEVSLKEIISIDYSFSTIEMETSMMNYARCETLTAGKLLDSGNTQIDIDVDPEDIEITDNVTLVWEIA